MYSLQVLSHLQSQPERRYVYIHMDSRYLNVGISLLSAHRYRSAQLRSVSFLRVIHTQSLLKYQQAVGYTSYQHLDVLRCNYLLGVANLHLKVLALCKEQSKTSDSQRQVAKYKGSHTKETCIALRNGLQFLPKGNSFILIVFSVLHYLQVIGLRNIQVLHTSRCKGQ